MTLLISTKRRKVALITNIIAPYRIPAFNKVSELAPFDFDVYFMAENESNREWKVYKEKIRFNYKVLKGLHFVSKNERMIHINFGLTYYLTKKNYDLIAIGGWNQPCSYEAFLWAKLRRKKVLFFGESTLRDKRADNSIYEKIKQFLVKHSDGFIPAGNAAKEYYKYLGAPDEKIFIAPFCADHHFFYNEYLRLKPLREEIKKKKGYQAITILYSGRFVWYKGIPYLLEAYNRLQKEIDDIALILLGDGPEKKKYEDYVKNNNLKNVFFEGFIQQESLPEYYIASDIFVLPSLSETWGLVINEAMAFGLPVISTDAAGASYDLVKNGINGFVVKAGDSKELYTALKILCENPDLRIRMGENSLGIIKEYTPENWAKKFIFAINKILEN
ncbi:MAG: glycosyltransferase family 4 protein [candidate division WOR-3 bacterium]